MFKRFFKQLGAVRILLLASFVIGFLFFGSYVLSVSAETKNAGPLKIEYPGADPLFSAANIAPGYSETKTLTITNQGTVSHSFAIAVSGSLGSLADVLHLTPKVSGSAVWDKTISDLATGDSNTIIGSIAPGGVATVDLMAYLPDVGNDYQGAATMTFDFIVGDQEPEPEVSILAPPGGGGGAASAGITGIGGEILGESTSPLISPSASPSGAVSGEKNDGEETKAEGTNYKFLYWLIPILVILIILFLLWRWRRREDKDKDDKDLEEI